MAIAAFERTLVSRNAPLDRYLQGDRKALSEEAEKGLRIFQGKGQCTECHDGVILTNDKFYALNVPENEEQEKDPRVATTRRFVAKVYHYEDYRTLSEDPGRYLITKKKEDWKAFKTPTLREIAKTGPYMHNGIFESLEQVIEFFDKGGGPRNTSLKPLKLTDAEKKALKTFLVEGLAGEEVPFRYPKVP
jgi:cytochrome c peroxidase